LTYLHVSKEGHLEKPVSPPSPRTILAVHSLRGWSQFRIGWHQPEDEIRLVFGLLELLDTVGFSPMQASNRVDNLDSGGAVGLDIVFELDTSSQVTAAQLSPARFDCTKTQHIGIV
jgi:hypothetical protein